MYVGGAAFCCSLILRPPCFATVAPICCSRGHCSGKPEKTVTIKAYRSGETSPYWSSDPYKEAVSAHSGEIQLSLSMPSKGGGVTEVAVMIDHDSFDELAAVMMKADADAAIRAFGLALAERKPNNSN